MEPFIQANARELLHVLASRSTPPSCLFIVKEECIQVCWTSYYMDVSGRVFFITNRLKTQQIKAELVLCSWVLA